MEAHATVAGERSSGDRLDELDRGRATVAIDRVDVRHYHTIRSEKRNAGVLRCSPLDRRSDVKLLHRRVQVRHDETDVKERIVDRNGHRARKSSSAWLTSSGCVQPMLCGPSCTATTVRSAISAS